MAKILVVDDYVANRKLTCALVSQRGHETFEAVDGLEALEMVRSLRP